MTEPSSPAAAIDTTAPSSSNPDFKDKPPSPSKRPSPGSGSSLAATSGAALAPGALQPIMEARPRLSAAGAMVEEDGEEDEEPHEGLESQPVLPPGAVNSSSAAFSPVPPKGTSLDRTSSIGGNAPVAPTPNPVATGLRPPLHHTASASSVRGASGQVPSTAFFPGLPQAMVSEPSRPSAAAAAPQRYPLQHAPSRQASFYATDLSRRPSVAGPTGAGGGAELGGTQRIRGQSTATVGRQATFMSKLSQADEDGDLADWKRCWVYCKSLPQRIFHRVDPLSRRMYQEAIAPLQRRFSDVEERRSQQQARWWPGIQGQGPVGPNNKGDRDRQLSTIDDGQAPCAERLRAMSVDDLRSSYVLGKLPSMALVCGDADEGDAEAPAVAPPGATRAGPEVDLIRKEDFLMKLCVTLHSYGCPIPRNEYSMQLLLQTLGVEGSFSVLPSMIFATFGAPISSNSETHILRVGGGLDCYKLRRVNHLVNQILEHRVESLPQAIAKLDSIIEEPLLYPWQAKLACYAISSGTVAPLFFKGSMLDGLLSLLIGVMAGTLWVLADSSYMLGKVGLVLTAFLTSFFATILTSHIPGSCALALHFGSITYLLPGWSITVSVIELSTQNLLSGTSRLMGSLMSSVLLGFGLDLGHRMAFWEKPEDWVSTAECHPVGPWAKIPLFLATVTCFCVLLKAAPAQWPAMLALSAMSYTTINVAFDRGMDPSSATVLTAFLIGIAGNLYSYATNSPALIPMLVAIFLIVPGGMSVKGVHAIAKNDMTGGVVWSNVLTVATSIAIGLFAASVLMYKPKLKVSNTVFF